jgi:hypothetical protein
MLSDARQVGESKYRELARAKANEEKLRSQAELSEQRKDEIARLHRELAELATKQTEGVGAAAGPQTQDWGRSAAARLVEQLSAERSAMFGFEEDIGRKDFTKMLTTRLFLVV